MYKSALYGLEGSKRLGRAQSFDHCEDAGNRTTDNHISKRSHRQKHDNTAGSTEALSKSDTLVFTLIAAV